MNVLPVTDADLNAYVDGQLAKSRVAAVEEALTRDPSLAAWVAQAKGHNAALHDALDPWLAEALPRELVGAAKAPGKRNSGARWAAWSTLAAAASLVVGVGLGWMLRGELLTEAGTPVTFQRQAAITHALYASDANRPVEIWANEEERLVRWLSKRLLRATLRERAPCATCRNRPRRNPCALPC